MDIIVGSVALKYYVPELIAINDRDCIMTYDEYKQFVKNHKSVVRCHYPISDGKKMFVQMVDKTIHEIEIAWPNSTAEMFMNLVLSDPESLKGEHVVPSLNALYAMKMSHRYLKDSPYFLKTMSHIKMMRSLGAQLTPYYSEWMKVREAETYCYTHPNLDTKKDSFFKDETFYIHDHDTLHDAVKLGSRPAYSYILADGAEVKCSVDKFNSLEYNQKLNCALEESYVLALERSLVPNNFKPDPDKAFKMALMKVCTSITSGWFREWCWENYDNVITQYSGEYVNKFNASLDRGDILPFRSDAV
jgi:hypothetical protein